ncbi:MAG: Crp/Fnr family transcriptional regulator [Thermonemataceae bacterium]
MFPLPDYITEKLQQKRLNPGDSFVEEGQIAKYLAFVETGLLRSYQIDYHGEEVTTNFFVKGSFCSAFHSFYEQAPSFEHIEALTTVRLKIIGYDTLQTLLEDSLAVNQYCRKSIEKTCISKDVRISKMLKLDARERYLWLAEVQPAVIEKAPLKHIASYLGMRPETLSRIRKSIIS